MEIENVTNEIEQIVFWYNRLPVDYNSINDLMYNRVQLVTLLFFYGSELGNVRKEWKRAEASTEIQRRKKTMEYIDAGQPISKANEFGKFSSLDDYALEKQYDGFYYSMRFVYDVAFEVLNTINQHISNLKKEQENSKIIV